MKLLPILLVATIVACGCGSLRYKPRNPHPAVKTFIANSLGETPEFDRLTVATDKPHGLRAGQRIKMSGWVVYTDRNAIVTIYQIPAPNVFVSNNPNYDEGNENGVSIKVIVIGR